MRLVLDFLKLFWPIRGGHRAFLDLATRRVVV